MDRRQVLCVIAAAFGFLGSGRSKSLASMKGIRPCPQMTRVNLPLRGSPLRTYRVWNGDCNKLEIFASGKRIVLRHGEVAVFTEGEKGWTRTKIG